jgi:hypothetical protein
MSLDQLVIALVVVIPLLDGLMRVLRRQTRQEGQPDKPLAQSSTPRPSSRLPAREGVDRLKAAGLAADTRPLPAAAPLLSPRRYASERLMRRERSRASEAPPGVPVSKVARLPWIDDLRPAIVLMTILGPCRALAPGDAPYTPP